jgi:predicted DNA-binding protein
MAVDRLSVTVPAELGAKLRALAESRGEAVSTIVTEAIEQQIRRAALRELLAADEREFGPIRKELLRAPKRKRKT